jgi:hypothetical protein
VAALLFRHHPGASVLDSSSPAAVDRIYAEESAPRHPDAACAAPVRCDHGWQDQVSGHAGALADRNYRGNWRDVSVSRIQLVMATHPGHRCAFRSDRSGVLQVEWRSAPAWADAAPPEELPAQVGVVSVQHADLEQEHPQVAARSFDGLPDRQAAPGRALAPVEVDESGADR